MAAEHDATDRKPYAPPTVTDFGHATKRTMGMWGESFEYIGSVYHEDDDPPDDEDPPDGGGGNN